MMSDDDNALSVKVKERITINFHNLFDIARYQPESARNGVLRLSDFKIFWGSMPPDPLPTTPSALAKVRPTVKVLPISVSLRLSLQNLNSL